MCVVWTDPVVEVGDVLGGVGQHQQDEALNTLKGKGKPRSPL